MAILQLFFICVFTALSPGPDLFLILRNQEKRGVANAFKTLAGIALGNLFWIILVLQGFNAQSIPDLPYNFFILLGGFFLIYLFYSAQASVSFSEFKSNSVEKKEKSFYEGLITNILNIKALLFYGAILSPFLKKVQLPNFFIACILMAAIVFAFSLAIFSYSYLKRKKIFSKSLIIFHRVSNYLFLALGLYSLYIAIPKIIAILWTS